MFTQTYYRYDPEMFEWPVTSGNAVPDAITVLQSFLGPSRDIFTGIFGFQVEILGCT